MVRNKRLAITRKLLPELRPGWALVRVRLAGICNTDVEILRGYHGFHGTPGHEFVGQVADIASKSSQAKAQWVGRRVAGEINIACAALGLRPICQFCKRGLKNHCARRKVLGIVGHDGAFAEYLALPVENLHLIPDTVTDEQAVFIEPLAAACEILEQVDMGRFKSAAVLGDGKLGQLIAMVMAASGLRVTVFGKHKEKLRLARRAGASVELVTGKISDNKRWRSRFPLVVEATGSASGLEMALAMTEPRGTLVLKSTFHGAARFETWPIVVNEIQIVGSRCGPFGRAIELLRAGGVDPRSLITRAFSLENANEAIQFAQKPGVMKVLLRPAK